MKNKAYVIVFAPVETDNHPQPMAVTLTKKAAKSFLTKSGFYYNEREKLYLTRIPYGNYYAKIFPVQYYDAKEI